MKRLSALCCLLFLATPVLAKKSCDELKSEIEAKLNGKGVKSFTLTVVPAADVKEGEGRVVGTCDGGKMKIVYKRGASSAP